MFSLAWIPRTIDGRTEIQENIILNPSSNIRKYRVFVMAVIIGI